MTAEQMARRLETGLDSEPMILNWHEAIDSEEFFLSIPVSGDDFGSVLHPEKHFDNWPEIIGDSDGN
jgi:hypothetical protein